MIRNRVVDYWHAVAYDRPDDRPLNAWFWTGMAGFAAILILAVAYIAIFAAFGFSLTAPTYRGIPSEFIDAPAIILTITQTIVLVKYTQAVLADFKSQTEWENGS